MPEGGVVVLKERDEDVACSIVNGVYRFVFYKYHSLEGVLALGE